eukprot:4242593-Pyramimonas_sp.AAC.1
MAADGWVYDMTGCGTAGSHVAFAELDHANWQSHRAPVVSSVSARIARGAGIGLWQLALGKEYTRNRHQSRKERENIPITGTNGVTPTNVVRVRREHAARAGPRVLLQDGRIPLLVRPPPDRPLPRHALPPPRPLPRLVRSSFSSHAPSTRPSTPSPRATSSR